MGSTDFISRCAWVVAAGAMLALSSCTLLFDPGNLGQGDDSGPPGGNDSGIPPDALPPGQFGLALLEPATVLEGVGAAWPVPILVRGQNIAPGATVELDGAGFDATQVPAAVDRDGTMIAFALRVPVLEDLDQGASDFVTVTVRSDGKSDSLMLTIQGLDELVASSLPRPDQVVAADLKPLYSRIDIDRNLTLTGGQPIRLVATAKIVLDGTLRANGQDANLGTPGQGGPGGCAGGLPDSNGGCGAGGGRGGGDDAPGGGGHFTIGTPGGGEPSNPGGSSTGRPEMVPLTSEQGNGGGGALDVAGGGGGGIVELTSQGGFTFERDGRIEAAGGRGGVGVCSASVANGSGGGGSGGAILLRAWDGFDDESETTALSVRGGDGGPLEPDTDCPDVGGAGSAGRIRVDTSALGVLPRFAATSPPPVQGPMLRSRNAGGNPFPVVVTQSVLTLDVVGQPSRAFFLDVNDAGPARNTMSASGTASVPVQLVAGLNRVCVVVVDEPASSQLSENLQCISIAYLP